MTQYLAKNILDFYGQPFRLPARERRLIMPVLGCPGLLISAMHARLCSFPKSIEEGRNGGPCPCIDLAITHRVGQFGG